MTKPWERDWGQANIAQTRTQKPWENDWNGVSHASSTPQDNPQHELSIFSNNQQRINEQNPNLRIMEEVISRQQDNPQSQPYSAAELQKLKDQIRSEDRINAVEQSDWVTKLPLYTKSQIQALKENKLHEIAINNNQQVDMNNPDLLALGEDMRKANLEKNNSKFGAFSAGALQGLTAGFGDEILSGAVSLPTAVKAALPWSDTTKDDLVKEYQQNKGIMQQYFKDAEEYAPKSYFGGDISGSIYGAGKLLKGAQALPKVGKAVTGLVNAGAKGGWGRSLAANSVIGSGLGAVNAYGRDENVATGALTGAAGGALGGAVVKGLNATWNKALVPAWKGISNRANATKNAMSKLNAALANDGIDHATAAARLKNLGNNATLMDIGDNIAGYGSALANMSGKSQSLIRTLLRDRNTGSNQRISAGVDSILGKAPQPSSVMSDIKAGQEVLAPAYKEVLQHGKPIDTKKIADFLDDAAITTRGGAQKHAKDMRTMLNVAGGDALEENPKILLEIRKAIDGKLANEADPNAIRMLADTRKQIDDILTKNVNGIKAVDGQYQALAQQKEAFEQGGRIFDTGKIAIRPDELAQIIKQGGVPNGEVIGASARPFRIAQGARAEIDRKLGTNINDKLALQKSVMGEGDWNRKKLEVLYGQNKTNKLANLLETEKTFANTSNNVMGNSATAGRAAAMRELGGTKIDGIVQKGIVGKAVGLPLNAATAIIKKIPAIDPTKRNEILGQMLAGDYQSTINFLAKLQKQGQITTREINPIMGAIWGATVARDRETNKKFN